MGDELSLRDSLVSFDGSFPDFSDDGGFSDGEFPANSSGEMPMEVECIEEAEAGTSGIGDSDMTGDAETACPVCGMSFPAEEISTHVDRCLLTSSGEAMDVCGLCGQDFPFSVMPMHKEECARRIQLEEDEALARSLAAIEEEDAKKPGGKHKSGKDAPKGGIVAYTPPDKSTPPPVPDVKKVPHSAVHECPLCKKKVVMSEMKGHFDVCLRDIKSRQQARDLEAPQEWTCEHCLEVFVDKDFYDMHTEVCGDKGQRIRCGACNKYTYKNELEKHKQTECRMHRCTICRELFTLSELDVHLQTCVGPKEKCKWCEELILVAEMDAHKKFCWKNPKCTLCSQRFKRKTGAFENHMKVCKGMQVKCHVCLNMVYETELNEHLAKCAMVDADESRISDMALSAVAWDDEEKSAIGLIRTMLSHEISETQLKAVVWTQENSERLSNTAYPALKDRFARLGWNETTLKRTLRYIRTEAPIIVHINLDNCIKFLLSDTHYRNQFETGTSNGTLNNSIRKQWEDRLFNKIYAKSDGFERVKYGVLNVINDANGVQCCSQYGDSYLQLKDVRLRCTFAAKDSSCSDVIPSSVEHYAHTLAEYNDNELKEVVAVATRRKEFGDSRAISTYKELQIHGPLELTKHVEALVVHERYANDTKMLDKADQFCRKANCRLIIMTPRTASYVPGQ